MVLFTRSVLPSALCALATWCFATLAQQDSTACSAIINAPDGQDVFNASLVQECLVSVPFNAAVATPLVAYWNDTLRFQSTLAYLKNPPASYQSPSVDVLGSIQAIQDGIDSGSFSNQYEFEIALQKLVFATRDEHLYLDAGILYVFTFASPRNVLSISIDGTQVPKLYFYDDVVGSQSFTTFQPSAIKSINGQEATTYIEDFAANNSYDLIEPHAEWNQMMISGAQDILGISPVFTGNAWFYPGDSIEWELENGTSFTEQFQGWYWTQGPTGPLETPGDFYNCFVLGLLPASYDPSATSDDSSDEDDEDSDSTSEDDVSSTNITSSPGWDSLWYPNTPDIAQPGLSQDQGGFLSGYFLNSTSTSVLSIPSFDEYDDALNTFQDTVDEFLARSKSSGLTKLVIDLQQNTGGQALLAIDTFIRFFPNIVPFAGSRMRAHDATNVMGNTMTDYYESLSTSDDAYDILAADEWVATSRINAETGANFSSWAEFYGPHIYHGDGFTAMQQYNLSSTNFTTESVGDEADDEIFSVQSPSSSSEPPYAAEDVILLTDGICGSSCALFLELMHHQAGVRVVTVGGRPEISAMQGASGSRGARALDLDTLDANIEFVQELLQNSSSPGAATFLPNRTTANDVFILGAGINLRDQVRALDTTPLQFLYVPADCRIFFTPWTILNYTALWEYAVEAAWTNPSLCVAGAGNSTTETDVQPETDSGTAPSSASFDVSTYIPTLGVANTADASSIDGSLGDVGPSSKADVALTKCSADADCPGSRVCRNIQLCVNTGTSTGYCSNVCKYGGAGQRCIFSAGVIGTCRLDSAKGTKKNTQGGFCKPAPASSCSSNGNINSLSKLNGGQGSYTH